MRADAPTTSLGLLAGVRGAALAVIDAVLEPRLLAYATRCGYWKP